MPANARDPATEAAVQTALAAARNGRVRDGYAIARRALQSGGDPIILNALSGMFAYRIGDLADAIEQLDVAHRGAPGDVSVAGNLIEALIAVGDTARALDIATIDVVARDPSWRLARLRAYLLQVAERFEEACAAYETIVAAIPDDFESWNNLGNAASGCGATELSVKALKRASHLRPNVAPTRINLARSLVAVSKFDDACGVLRRAMVDFPDDVKPVTELAGILRQLWRDEDVPPVLEEACRREPGNPDLWVSLGTENFIIWNIDRAEAAFRKALEISPTHEGATVLLAILLEHVGRNAELDDFLAERAAMGLAESVQDFIRALICGRDHHFAEGLAILDRIPGDIEPVRCAHLEGQFHERLGETDLAFAAFSKMNDLRTLEPDDPVGRASRLRVDLEAESRHVTSDWHRNWRPLASSDRPSPCFLVGFPRSGTTLLDTMLMGHPDVRVMEERPALKAVEDALGELDRLPQLDGERAEELRAVYYEHAARWIDLASGSLLIDKFPLYLNKVPLIHRLFPDAKFILALRHPCDVVLSCFITNFRLNNAMSNFLELETAAQFYDQTFSYWERARSIMPISVHTIVYEEMIADPETHMRGLFDYLGLDWHAAALDHQHTAANRGLISTASYAQVTQPIYKRAAGRWTRYRKHLEPVLPILAPWVEKFGYSLDG